MTAKLSWRVTVFFPEGGGLVHRSFPTQAEAEAYRQEVLAYLGDVKVAVKQIENSAAPGEV